MQEMHDDEIDLIDILRVLWQRKVMIILVSLLFVLGGVAFALLLPKKYEYTSTIEIGKNLVEGSQGLTVVPLQDVQTVVAKLEEGYIPIELNRAFQETQQDDLEVNVKAPKDSQLLLLKSKAAKIDEPRVTVIQQKIVDRLLDDHEQIINATRQKYMALEEIQRLELKRLEDPKVFAVRENELKAQWEQSKRAMADNKDALTLLKSRLARIEETKKLLQEQIQEVKSTLAVAHKNREAAVSEVTDEARAMTLLMIGNQIEENRTRLARLEERLYIELENERQSIEKQMADNSREAERRRSVVDEIKGQLDKLYVDHEREQSLQKQKIAEIGSRLSNLRPTQAMSVAVSSIKPVGPRRALVVVLAGAVGLFGAIILAFLMEAIKRAGGIRGKRDHAVSA